MKIEKIFTGSWFPRTKLHLKELFNFLKYQNFEPELTFNKKRMRSLYKSLGVQKVEYYGATFDKIKVYGTDLNFEYFEDGLLVLEKDCKEIKEDLDFLNNFYEKKLTPALSELYSRGAPVSLLTTIIALAHRVRTAILVLSSGSESEVNNLLKDLGSDLPHAKVKDALYQVYFTPKFIVIVSENFQSENCYNLVRHYIFFREYENQMHKYLNINRIIWDSVSEILKKDLIRYKELPKIRENLLRHKEQSALIQVRLGQMNNYLSLKMRDAEKNNFIDFLDKYKANRFLKIQSMHEYTQKLWRITDDSLSSAAELLQSLYQENIQKEFNSLQAIFLISVVAAFLTMGAMPGATLKFFDPKGTLVSYGNLISFDFLTLVKFGLVVFVFSTILYCLWNFIFKNIRKFRIISAIKKEK